MRDIFSETKMTCATNNFQGVALDWWNTYRATNDFEYLPWEKFIVAFKSQFMNKAFYKKI